MSIVTLHTDRAIGSFKSIHGVNNGPVCYGALVDVSDYYTAMGTPLVRLHDPNWPNPREVDIHLVFPDFSKDPEDPSSYDFSTTDEYIRTVLATGANIVYRLGQSIEHTKKKYYVHPPADYDKWVQICIGIIKHYNHGWADGFNYGIEYWEIWNEPDLGDRMWSGTPEQYYALYETAVKGIKAFDPTVKVGGPVVANPNGDFVTGFLAYCQTRNLPIDFFSWHTYSTHPSKISDNALRMRSLLEQYGYPNTESHINEWNFLSADFNTMWDKGNEYVRKEAFDRQKSEEGAAFVGNVLTNMQDLPIDQANYYDGQPTALFCGLFDYHGVPQKTYYAFQAFEDLRKHGTRLACEASDEIEGLTYLAGQDGEGNIAVLVSGFHVEAHKRTLRLEGLNESEVKRYEIHAIDNSHTFGLIEEGALSANELELSLSYNSVLYVRLLK